MMHVNKSKRTRWKLKQANKSNLLRFFVHKTNKHIYAAIEKEGKILLALSSKDKSFESVKGFKPYNVQGATLVGEHFGEMAKKNQIDAVYFDRGAFKYHGRIKAIADGARKSLRF